MRPRPGSRLEVLIIDDDPFIRETIQLFLESEGLQVRCACDGEEGIEFLHQHEPDVALIDLRMPRLGGIEVLRKFKKYAPEVEVVMATGAATLESALSAMKLGAYSYIEKPIVDLQTDLLEVLLRAAERRKLRQTNRELQAQLQMTQHQLEAEQRKTRTAGDGDSIESTLRKLSMSDQKQIEDLVLSYFPENCSHILYIRKDQWLTPLPARAQNATEEPCDLPIDRFTDPGERWRAGDFSGLFVNTEEALAFPLFWRGRLEGLIVIAAEDGEIPTRDSLSTLRSSADAIAALLASLGTRSSATTG